MKDNEKQIVEELANDIYGLKSCDTYFEENCKLLAYDLVALNWVKLTEDSLILSKEEYDCLKKIEKAYDPFWFCAFGGCEGACKECKDTCEMSIFVKERKKFYDKLNENICTFKLENQSQEYVDGYTQAIADICGRLDKTAVELGVNIKE